MNPFAFQDSETKQTQPLLTVSKGRRVLPGAFLVHGALEEKPTQKKKAVRFRVALV
jgi:hypothetical protein